MSYGLNSFKRGYIGDYSGSTIGAIKGHTESLDYGANHVHAISCSIHAASKQLAGPL